MTQSDLPTLDGAEAFFTALADAPALENIRGEADRKAQFVPIAHAPFAITVSGGRLVFAPGLHYPPDQRDAIHLIETQPVFADILAGRALLGEAIFHHQIQVPGYRNKEPELASLSRLLRFGVWQLVPGAEILRPAK